jgi:coenzyme F420-reducing hydrogenase delta subunit
MTTEGIRIIGFCCSYGGYSSADLAGALHLTYSPDVVIIMIPCAGRVDVLHILSAFRDGADAVFVAGCLERNCNFEYGNFEAKKRIEHAKRLLNDIGIEKNRVEIFNVASNQGWRFPEIVEEMISRVKTMGPSPLRKVNR